MVLKARDAAFAAVQHYNNPTTAFRSGNYIVLMIIGYTALFHAIFERRGISYVALDRHGQPRLTSDGEPMLWDALHCARVYDQSPKSPLLANLDLFIPIRHKIEHRFMPQLDPWIAGHCQSLLMNFERILTTEFTPYYSLNTSLTIALQFSTQRTAEAADALRRMHSAEYEALKEHIHRYEATLPDEIVADPNYAFRVWLVPKTARSARKSDISIEVADVQQLAGGRARGA